MAIAVLSTFDMETEYFRDGTKWVIDGEKQLHVIGEDGNIASYGCGHWSSVKNVELAEFTIMTASANE